MEDRVKKKLRDFLLNQQAFPQELSAPDKRDELFQLLDSYLIIMYHRRKVLILQPDEIPNKVYFVEQGIVRGFTVGDEGKKEKTVSLWLGKSLMTDAVSFVHQLKTKLIIEVMPDTILASITYEQLIKIFQAFPSSTLFLSCLIEKHAENSNTRLNDKNLTAWEKLVEMRQNFPGIDVLVQKETIASFLNITPQHLSRIIRENRRDGH